MPDLALSAAAAAARRAFDERFAAPHPIPEPPGTCVVLVRLGGARRAIRLAELAGVHLGLGVMQIPALAPGLLGLACARGRLLPIFDLAALTGAGAAVGPRRVLLEAAGDRVLLAVDALEIHAEICAANLVAAGPAGLLARMQGELHPVLDLGAVIEALRLRREGAAER